MAKAVFYRHFSGDPLFNMAIDEWLARRASVEPGAVYLRLYTWRIGAVTIGLHQKEELALDFSGLWDTPVIRRVTGGRAVYHDPSELTYAIAFNTRHLPSPQLIGSLGRTSAAIAEALTRFLARLGRQSQYMRRSSPGDSRPARFHTAPCFDSVSRHEVVAGSHKIAASAQRRIRTTVLQHGAIKLNGIAPHPALAGQPQRKAGASDAVPIVKKQFDLMASTFAREMGAFFGLAFEDGQLGEADHEEVAYRTAILKKNPLSRRNFLNASCL